MVDAVIVNWNGRGFLPGCLRSLRGSKVPVRITVVDNASTDGSVEYLRTEHPDIEILALEENRGYAAGANAGLHATCRPYAIILNPDVALAADHLARLVARAEADPHIGAAQGKLYRARLEDFVTGRFESGGPLDSTGHVIRRTRMVYDRGQGRADGPEFAREVSIFSACGAGLFLRREMLEDLAPDGEYFDEDFFAYKEDIDLCWRARLLGWDIRYVPTAVAWHVRALPGEHRKGRGAPPRVRRHSWMNHWLLMLKNDELRHLLLDLPWLIGWEGIRAGYALLRDPALIPAYATVWKQVPKALRGRRYIHQRQRISAACIRKWFRGIATAPEHPPRSVFR